MTISSNPRFIAPPLVKAGNIVTIGATNPAEFANACKLLPSMRNVITEINASFDGIVVHLTFAPFDRNSAHFKEHGVQCYSTSRNIPSIITLIIILMTVNPIKVRMSLPGLHTNRVCDIRRYQNDYIESLFKVLDPKGLIRVSWNEFNPPGAIGSVYFIAECVLNIIP